MVTPYAPPTIADLVGRTPVVRLQRLPVDGGGMVLAKLEGDNPAGSVKDRPAFSMIAAAEQDGRIAPGATLVEATSGNTGIALAAAAAVKGYRMILVMPAGSSRERSLSMTAYGAEVVETDKEGGMELARDTAEQISRDTGAVRLDQFANPANPRAHELATGPEIWEQTQGTVTHVVSSMGTTGTVTGLSRGLHAIAPRVRVIGIQPAPGAAIPGIRAWPPEYLPRVFDPTHIAEVRTVTQERAVETTRALARREGLLVGMSSGGAAAIALEIAAEEPGSTVVFIACDRGDRYLSTPLFDTAGEQA
ncbi:cysteine synthase CysM [Demequina sp. SYSU T00192]|uniref:Cysteine synthase CysM n=1 Tax=Demequina litoralis TaxID=3051660 RepID=A0ABT8G9B5_9MICO|nr:cysteine synthase CysM [Demequina sp. SYSU T00192]MDN4475739.1 cysteine synthase CysM [Demequina sp. SYSU T00192]